MDKYLISLQYITEPFHIIRRPVIKKEEYNAIESVYGVYLKHRKWCGYKIFEVYYPKRYVHYSRDCPSTFYLRIVTTIQTDGKYNDCEYWCGPYTWSL